MQRDPVAFDCDHCRWGRHCDESNPSPYPKWVIKHQGKLVFESTTCLKPHSDADTSYVLGLFGHYKRGFLLKAGGVEDQPKYYLDLMATINWYITDGG